MKLEGELSHYLVDQLSKRQASAHGEVNFTSKTTKDIQCRPTTQQPKHLRERRIREILITIPNY
jgi:hypothetical protein